MISEHALRSPAAGHTAAGPLWRRPLGWDRWTRLAMLAATVAVAVPALVAVATGSWTIPHADSWSFDKTALTFFRTGEFHLQGWGQMFLLGQVVSAAPLMAVFGANHGALSLYGAVAGVAVLLLGFAVARRIVGSGRGLAVLLSVAAFPAFGLLATSFMTDLPSMAAALLCLLVGGAAIRRVSLPLLGLTVAFGVLGFTMREQSVAGLFAVILTAVAYPRLPRIFRAGAVVAGAFSAAVLVGLEHLRHGMPNADVPPWHLSSIRLDSLPPSLPPALFTIGVALAPLAVWALVTLRGRDWLDPGRLIGWGIGGMTLVSVAHRTGWFFVTLPNYLNARGAYAAAGVGLSPTIFSPWMWDAIQIIGAFGGVVLAGELGRTLSRPRLALRQLGDADPLVAAVTGYGVLAVLGMVGLALAGELQFDRYFLPLVLPFGLLLVRRPAPAPRRRLFALTAGALVFAALAFVCWTITVSTDARDAGRWEAAQHLVRAGVPAEQINAGLEWDGSMSSVPADPVNKAGHGRPIRYTGQTWTKVFDRSNDCWVISMSEPLRVTHARLVQTWPVHPYGWDMRTVSLYIYERRNCAGGFRSPRR